MMNLKRKVQFDLDDITWAEYFSCLKESRFVVDKYHFQDVKSDSFELVPIIEKSIDVFFFIEFKKKSDSSLTMIFKSYKMFLVLIYGCFFISIISLVNLFFSLIDSVPYHVNIVLVLLPLFQFVIFYIYFNIRVSKLTSFFKDLKNKKRGTATD